MCSFCQTLKFGKKLKNKQITTDPALVLLCVCCTLSYLMGTVNTKKLEGNMASCNFIYHPISSYQKNTGFISTLNFKLHGTLPWTIIPYRPINDFICYRTLLYLRHPGSIIMVLRILTLVRLRFIFFLFCMLSHLTVP